MVKGIIIKEKSKRKKKKESGSRPLLAGSGRILIPGPDSDPHLRIWVRVLALKHGLFGLFMDFLRTFYGLFGLESHLKDMLGWVCVCGGGELLPSKSGLKQEKLSARPRYFLDCAQVFYTSRGGIGGPNSPYGALGSPGKLSRNLFY
jgi:hypothetical protein